MYAEFLVFCEAQGLEFPCTATQFAARVADFLREIGGSNAEYAALMDQGVGPGWRDDR